MNLLIELDVSPLSISVAFGDTMKKIAQNTVKKDVIKDKVSNSFKPTV